MVDLSWSHILIVLIVALVVVGPKDLPRLMRMTGRWVSKARAMADQFRKSFDDMARQSELDDLRAELEALRHERPLADVDRALHAPVLPVSDSPDVQKVEGEPAAPASTVPSGPAR
ncbi:MAG TPA: Sec-independent protein translocase protein TatB [Rhizomicrobium sp.]|jgi:sec-independent protein translocase protein TatB|nr:Sec-independent protein translocase protein TatB [Rhizomicrobium sp.]